MSGHHRRRGWRGRERPVRCLAGLVPLRATVKRRVDPAEVRQGTADSPAIAPFHRSRAAPATDIDDRAVRSACPNTAAVLNPPREHCGPASATSSGRCRMCGSLKWKRSSLRRAKRRSGDAKRMDTTNARPGEGNDGRSRSHPAPRGRPECGLRRSRRRFRAAVSAPHVNVTTGPPAAPSEPSEPRCGGFDASRGISRGRLRRIGPYAAEHWAFQREIPRRCRPSNGAVSRILDRTS